MAARDDAFGWLYISPLMLVLLPFFVAPILVVFAASFMQSDGFGGIIASLDAAKLYRHFQFRPDGQSLLRDRQVHDSDLAVLADHRLLGRLLSGLPRPQPAARDRAVPALHRAVLDLEHHPHDFLDPAARQGRPDQHGADQSRRHPRAARVPAVLRLLGGGRLCASAHDLHDRADLQFDGAASTSAWSRQRSTPAPAASTSCADHPAAVQERHRARLHLRRLDRDGRLLRRQGDERRRLGVGGRRASTKMSACCNTRPPRRARSCSPSWSR